MAIVPVSAVLIALTTTLTGSLLFDEEGAGGRGADNVKVKDVEKIEEGDDKVEVETVVRRERPPGGAASRRRGKGEEGSR